MSRTTEQETTRVKNITFSVLHKSNPAIHTLFRNQQSKCRPDHAQANRLKTAQIEWMDERRKTMNPTLDINAEFAYQKKQYWDFGDEALCPAPLTDGEGLVTLIGNGLPSGALAAAMGPHESDRLHAEASAMHRARQKELVVVHKRTFMRRQKELGNLD